MNNGTIKQKAVSNVIWSSIERFSVQGIQFLLSIIIARLVLPSDYGLIAMILVFLAIAQTFIDSGFSTALIQKQSRTVQDYSTVFYFNLGIGILFYVLLFFSAPFISSFYEQPELTLITRVFGLNLIFMSLSVVQKAKLTIELNFKKQAFISLFSVIISGGLGVFLAYKGYGVWSLVIQALVNNCLASVLLWLCTSRVKLGYFSSESFYVLFGYGSKLLFAGLINTIYLNLYSLMIGKYYKPTFLGYYNRTSTIAQFPSNNISVVINRVLFPVLCQVQHQKDQLIVMYKKAVCITAYCVFPLMTLLFCYSSSLIYTVLGEKWMPSVPILRILCLAYILNPVMNLMVEVINVCGRSDYALKGEYYKKTVSIILLFITMPFGIEAMCWGLVAYSFCDFFIVVKLLKRLLPEVSIKLHLKLLSPFFLLCFCIVISSLIINYIITFSIWRLIWGIPFGMVTWIYISYLCKFSEFLFFREMLMRYVNVLMHKIGWRK